MSRDAQHRIKFDPQRIVGFISGWCGGVDWRSARADWPSRTCNASLRALATTVERVASAEAAASSVSRLGLRRGGCSTAPEHPDALVRGRGEGAPQWPPANTGRANEITLAAARAQASRHAARRRCLSYMSLALITAHNASHY